MSTDTGLGAVLIVEDDAELGRLLQRGLSDEGYEAVHVTDGVAGLIAATQDSYAAVLIDVMLPGMSGFEVCRRLRDEQSSLPIILLTARDAVEDRVRGLDAGADDYMIKPFAFTELTARLRALRRREQAAPQKSLRVGNLTLDHHEHAVTVDGTPISLSPKEFTVLRILAEHIGETVSREQLLLSAWGVVDHVDTNVVDQYVSYLRRKIDQERAGITITTARGVGFRMIVGEP